MAQSPHSPPDVSKRPKGILKNSTSFQHISPEASLSPSSEQSIAVHDSPATSHVDRPQPQREMSEKEIVQMNTELNAGGHRRNSSNPARSMSRRQSSQSVEQGDESVARLKWDEANLYLNEGQMGGKMKIDEPKTPFVHSADLKEDEEESSAINAQDIAVDELELKHSKPKRTAGEDIPGLDLGEPEMETKKRRESDSDRRVTVGSEEMDVDGESFHHGEGEESMTPDELAKHRKFEAMRRKHYEMKNVKGMLGHVDADEEDEDEAMTDVGAKP
ncbi:hypothetical protein LTR62_001697 [Meristemomyces frigidus]|uniref:Glc8 protein n=1 Tax=Meristemomyces frigidus TaxID=1508187 RepID=A0AAN7YM90_9PEZI|nr:hypothetical protein LTR62_001697 [Meristemomyces frigidus]